MSIPHCLIGSGDHKVLVLHDWCGTSADWESSDHSIG